MRAIPYDTGKVKIGLAYEPPRLTTHMSKDAEMLQEMLLRKGRRLYNKQEIIFIKTAVILTVAFGLILASAWMFKGH